MGAFFAELSSAAPASRCRSWPAIRRTAALVALGGAEPAEPVSRIGRRSARPGSRGETIEEKGAIVVWPATDTAGAPPAAIKAAFPDLVPEVPRGVRARGAGPLPLLRIGWGMIRPRAPGAPQAQ